MRLSESLRRGIMETSVGGVINRFGFKKRRTTLFFEDILAEYIKVCEIGGYENKMMHIGEKWGSIGTKQLGTLNVFHSTELLNYLAKNVWSNVGLIEDCRLTKEGSKIIIETKKEFITRIIGENKFMAGVFGGCLDSYFGKKSKLLEIAAKEDASIYVFEITDETHIDEGKSAGEYNRLNEPRSKDGFTLKNALLSRIFTIKDKNRIYFRDRPVIPVENTVFHIISNENVLMERVPLISYGFFRKIISKNAPYEKKFLLLKTLFQVMGWCSMKILSGKEETIIALENLPVGLQKENDNWDFIERVIIGYVWNIDKRFNVKKRSVTGPRITITLSRKA